MNEYYDQARSYFERIDGLHLFPSLKHWIAWLWIASAIFWLGMTLHELVLARAVTLLGIMKVAAPEALFIYINNKVQNWKTQRLTAAVNQALGTSFKKGSECREAVLRSAVEIQPAKYLKAAKEIDDLLSLERKFLRRVDLISTEFQANSIYDRDGKARLVTLVVASISVLAALMLRGDSAQELVFSALSDPQYIALVVLFAGLATIIFFGLVGLRIIWLTLVEIYIAWRLRLSSNRNKQKYRKWLLSYLARDLVNYYKPFPHSSEVLSTEGLRAAA